MIGNVLAAQGMIGGVLATGRRPGGFVGAYDAIPSIVAADETHLIVDPSEFD